MSDNYNPQYFVKEMRFIRREKIEYGDDGHSIFPTGIFETVLQQKLIDVNNGNEKWVDVPIINDKYNE